MQRRRHDFVAYSRRIVKLCITHTCHARLPESRAICFMENRCTLTCSAARRATEVRRRTSRMYYISRHKVILNDVITRSIFREKETEVERFLKVINISSYNRPMHFYRRLFQFLRLYRCKVTFFVSIHNSQD